MGIVRLLVLIAGLAASLSAQPIVPYFTRDSVLPVWGKRAQSLMPKDLVAIYGRHLAPVVGCAQPAVSKGSPYPTELCGVQVTVAGIPAGLLAVLETQINLQVPAGVPKSGEGPIVINVRGVMSQPVMVPFGKPKVKLSVIGMAYVHMPVWIALERPYPHDTYYPYSLSPWKFGGGEFEVKHKGVPMKPLPIYDQQYAEVVSGPLNGSLGIAGSPTGRLPLHLRYRFDLPGRYDIRFTGTQLEPDAEGGIHPKQVDQSDWTQVDVLPFSAAQRQNWIQEQIRRMPSSPGLLLGDAIPSLLAIPDELVLPALLEQLYHPDELVRRYMERSLAMFDEGLLRKELTRVVREKGATEEIARIIDGREQLFEGGHQAFLDAITAFLKSSSSPLALAGALQYLVWASNHDWGKTPEFQKRFQPVVLDAASHVLERGDARSQQMLAEALGGIKADASRDWLWKMIQRGNADEQAKIALSWIGDPRDLPRMAALLSDADAADPYGYRNSSLAYALHRAYGDAALPFLKQAARNTKQIWVRTSCARELALAGEPEGFQNLLRAMDEMPSFKPEALQFARDSFPGLRTQPDDAVMAFLKARAQVQ